MKKNKMLYRIVAAVLACAVVALALVTYQSRSSSNAPVAEGAVTATGSAKGMEGDVVVEVTADATTIYSITVKEQNETQGIGSVVCEQLPDTMVAANSYNVDGIAGATVTSDALKEAVKAALTSAGLDASAFAVAQTSDAAVEKTAESLDCDVVIVGAGGAGLTAAAQAAENGAKVIVVEKMPIVGGNSLKATGRHERCGHQISGSTGHYGQWCGRIYRGYHEWRPSDQRPQLGDRDGRRKFGCSRLAGCYRCSAAQSRCNGRHYPQISA